MVTQPSSCSRSATLYCTIELHQFVLRHVRSSVLAERCDRRWHLQPSCYVCHYWGIPPLLRSSSPSPRGRALLYGSAATAMVSSKSAFSSATSSRSAATSLSVAAAARPDAASSLPVTALLKRGGGGFCPLEVGAFRLLSAAPGCAVLCPPPRCAPRSHA